MTTPTERCVLLANVLRNPGSCDLPGGVSDSIGGRVIFGTEEDDFAFLSSETQPFPFIVGPQDLVIFCTKPTHMHMMEAIGFEREWVESKVRKGNEFRLALFPADDFEDGLISPTWDNLLSLVSRESPQAGEKLAQHLPALRSTPYKELCEQVGYDMSSIPLEVYQRVTSIADYGNPSTPNDLGHARAFLRATFKCTPLFSGDGFAYSETGERGVQEFLVKRVPFRALPGAEWVVLNL